MLADFRRLFFLGLYLPFIMAVCNLLDWQLSLDGLILIH